MIRSIITILLLTFNIADVYCQAEESSLQKLRDDTSKVNQLNALAEKIQFADPVKAIGIIETSISTATKINYPLGLSVAYSLRAGLLFYEMKLDSCKMLLDKAYMLVNTSSNRDSKIQTANLINRYAAIDQRQQNYVSAVERYLQAAAIFKQMGDEPKIINSYYNLAGIYKYLGDTAQTFFYARQTNKLALKINDTIFLIRGLIALADAYNFAADYDSSMLISRMGLAMAVKRNIPFAVGIFNKYIGLYFANKKMQYDTAIMHYNTALQNFNAINVTYDIAMLLQNMGNAYLRKADYTNAKLYLEQAVAISKKSGFDYVRHLSLPDLVMAEEKMGNAAESFRYLKEYVALNDSMQSKNSSKKVYELEVKYQRQNSEALLQSQQKLIKQKSLLNYVLIFGLVLLLGVLLLLYNRHRNKQKLQLQRITKLETEQQLAATEAVLKGEEQERTRIAKDLHDGLGGMLSGIKYAFGNVKGNLILTPENSQAFERSMDMLDSSIKEMRRLAHNMMPEALVKFGLDTALKDLCNDVNQSGALKVNYQSLGMENIKVEQTAAITIYRIVQELLNNTMKHATATNAIVQLSKTENILAVTVEDDGKGFDKNMLSTSKGIGWDNIRNRVDFLKGKVDVDSQWGKGTSVHIEFNV